MDNSKNRLHDVFFYGLYMDPVLLEEKGVEPRNPRIAMVENYQLRVGNKATLLRVEGKQAYGIVYSLTHDEIYSLYWGAGFDDYASEAMMVRIGDEEIPALCCNLIDAPAEDESNPEYDGKLKVAMLRLGVPLPLG